MKFRVTAPGLNVRAVPTTADNEPIAEMPEGTVFERVELSPDEKWARIHVTLFGKIFDGWASASPNNSEPVSVGAAVAGLSSELFSVERRRKYVDSVLGDPDKFNFFRPGRSAWNEGIWYHSFERDETGETFRVGVDWKAAQKGEFVIRSRTAKGTPFNSVRDTFCNFNVSFCYHLAYGGPCLQFLHNVEHSANDLVDMLTKEWKNVDRARAARIANAGGFVIAGRKAPKHGHVVFLMEGSDEGGDPARMHAFHVGGGLPRFRTIAEIWGGDKVHFVVPPATFAAFEAAGG